MWWNTKPKQYDPILLQTFIANQKLILELLGNLTTKTKAMSQQLDDLTTEVSNNTTVTKSALTLIQGLAKQLADAGTDPAKLQALRDSLAENDAALAAAVAANTPAA